MLGSRKLSNSSTSSMGKAVRILIPGLIVLWLLFVLLLRAPSTADIDLDKGSKVGALRGSVTSDSHNNGNGGVLANLAALHEDGKNLHEINVEHEKELSGHDVAFSVHPGDEFHTNHLVIVAGHAVVRLAMLNRAATDDASWWLLKYQRGQGFPTIISSHVRKGLELAAEDPKSLLIFSGGQTRKDVGPTSEAASYYYLADTQGWIPKDENNTPSTGDRTVRDRLFLDEFARDSYENLLFSLCRYREITGGYPEKVSVVGFDFKEARFVDQHRKAMGFPIENFHYVGLTPPEGSGFDTKVAAAGEEKVVAAYAADPYGCTHSLADKRELRNPFLRSIPYEEACPELHNLVHWCGPGSFDRMSDLPWS
jgi:hypothetical protein